MNKQENENFLREFSPQFLANGIVGMFNTGEYESVEVKITFNKHRDAVNSGAAELQPPTAPCGSEEHNNVTSA